MLNRRSLGIVARALLDVVAFLLLILEQRVAGANLTGTILGRKN
jgi:hypothetical protein